jgi:hypothetical protein
MRGQHGARIDHGVTAERRFLAQRVVHPGRGQAEGRLGGVRAGQFHGAPLRIHEQDLARVQFAASGFDFLDADDVVVRAELHIVENAHRRHDEAHLGRELTAQRLDLIGDAVSLGVFDQRQQAVAKFHAQQVERQRRRNWFFRRRHLRGLIGFLTGGFEAHVLLGVPQNFKQTALISLRYL